MKPASPHGDCLTTCHPDPRIELVLVDLVRGNRITVAALDPAQGILVGRSVVTGLNLDGLSASRSHCRIRKGINSWQIEDLDSSNGTWLNGENIRFAELQPGDILQMGENRFRVEDTMGCQNPQATKNLLTRLFQTRSQPIPRQAAA